MSTKDIDINDRLKYVLERRKRAIKMLVDNGIESQGASSEDTFFICFKYSYIKIIIDSIANSNIFLYLINITSLVYIVMASCLMFQYTGDLKLKIIFLKYFVLFSFLHFFEAFIIILSKGLWNNHDSYFRCGINYIDMFVLILDLILYIQIITTGFYFASVYILIPTIKLWKCCFQCKAIYKKLYVIKTCSNTVIASILAFFLFLFFLANFIEIIFENFSRKACVNKNDTDKILTRLYGIRLCGSFKCPKDYECRELEITDTSVQIRWLFSTLFESIIISFTTMTSKLSTAFIYNINDRFDTSQFVSFLFPCVIPPLLYKIAEGIILSNFILNFMKKDIRTKFHTKFIQLRNKQFLNAPSSREVDVNNYDRKDKNFFEFFKIAYQCIASISSYLLSGHYSTMAAHEFRKKSEKIKKYLEPRVKTFYFSLFEISLILANTILLMSYRVDHHTTYYIICIVQIFITPIFTFLAILRWIAYGRNEFRKLRLFIPDFIVTIFSFIDVFLFFTKNMIYGLNSLKLFFVVSLIYHTRENKSLNRYFKLQGKMLKSFFILLIPILIAMATVLGLFGVQHQLMFNLENINFLNSGDQFANPLLIIVEMFTGGDWLNFYKEKIDLINSFLIFFIFIFTVIIGRQILGTLLLSTYVGHAHRFIQKEHLDISKYMESINPLMSIREEEESLKYYSLFIFSGSNRFRLFIIYFMKTKIIAFLHKIATFTSSVVALLSITPLQPTYLIANYIKIGCTIYMLIFLILEIIAYGFVLHKGSYLRNASRVIEILSIIQLIISLIPTRFLTKYTVAAILIPLRLLIIINGFFVVYRIKIIRIFTLKMISLIYSSRYFFVVLFISHIVMSIIGLYAINESKYYCSDIHAPIHHCRGYYFIYDDVKDGNIILTPRKIKPSSLDYDNIYNSFNSIMALRYFSLSDFYSFKKLFIISTNFSQQTITTLLIFIFIFTFLREAIIRPTQWAIFFYLNPDMTKNTFKIEYDEYDYLDLFMKNMLKTIPTNERDFKLHRLITSNIYKLANFSFNFLFLCLSVWQNSDKFLVISLFSKICYLLIHCVYISIVLIIECLLFKKNVYKRAYPYLCACLYLGCFGEIFIQLLEKCGTNSLKYVFIFRILQIFGQFKIFLNFDIFGILFMEIIKFSKIIFILIVICSFLFYIFLIMGTSMFHNIAQDSNSYINEYQNFLYFGATFMTILRITFGYDILELAFECSRPTKCIIGTVCGTPLAFYFFFLVNYFVSEFIYGIIDRIFVVSFMVALKFTINPILNKNLDDMKIFWHENKQTDSKIRVNSLYVLLRKLPPPFGIGLMASDEILTDKLMRLHIPVDKDCCVQFKPTAMAMLRDAYSLFSKGKMKDEDEKFRKYLQDTYQMTNLEALKYVPQRILGKEKFLVEIAVARKIYLNFLKSKNRNDSAKQNIFVTPLILQEKSKNK